MKAPAATLQIKCGAILSSKSNDRGTFVYVLCSDPSDSFDSMAAVAIASLRLSNPKVRVIVVLDYETANSESAALHEIEHLADEIIVQHVSLESTILRSRSIKINLRRTVIGDFVYLDCDTFVLSEISKLSHFDCDVAAAPDLNPQGRPSGVPPGVLESYVTLGWAPVAKPYLNAGVVFMRDNAATRSMADQMVCDWERFRSVIGRPNDQPAFNHAAFGSEVRLKILPASYNAQIVNNPSVGRRAKVVHVFSGDFENRSDTVLHLAARRLRDHGVIDLDLIRDAQRKGHVWTSLDTAKKAMSAGAYGRSVTLGLSRFARFR